jgi:hypothetical protein
MTESMKLKYTRSIQTKANNTYVIGLVQITIPFFLEKCRRTAPHNILRENKGPKKTQLQVPPYGGHTQAYTKGSINTHSATSAYRLAAKKDRPLAPAISHLSSSACSRRRGRFGAPPSKTALFRCFQIIQAPRMRRESRPFPIIPFTPAEILSHHSKKETQPGCGAKLLSWA